MADLHGVAPSETDTSPSGSPTAVVVDSDDILDLDTVGIRERTISLLEEPGQIPVTSQKELRHWYAYGFGEGPFYSWAMLLISLLMVGLAKDVAVTNSGCYRMTTQNYLCYCASPNATYAINDTILESTGANNFVRGTCSAEADICTETQAPCDTIEDFAACQKSCTNNENCAFASWNPDTAQCRQSTTCGTVKPWTSDLQWNYLNVSALAATVDAPYQFDTCPAEDYCPNGGADKDISNWIPFHRQPAKTSTQRLYDQAPDREWDAPCEIEPLDRAVGGVTFSSWPVVATSISIALEVLLFTFFSPLADFGSHRKSVLEAVATFSGAFLCTSLIMLEESAWWWGFIIILLCNTSSGFGSLLQDAFLPIYAASHSSVEKLRVSGAGREEVKEAIALATGELAAKSMRSQFAGALSNMLISFVILLIADFSVAGSVVCLFLTGVWQLGFTFMAVRFKGGMDPRPGPPLPAGKKMYQITTDRLRAVWNLKKDIPELFKYLFAYFIFSDGDSTLASVAPVFASAALHMGTDEFLIGLYGLTATMFLGSMFWEYIHSRGWISALKIVYLTLFLEGLIPVYAFLFLSSKVEMIIVMAYYGFIASGLITFQRSVYSEIIPLGRESQFMGFLQITDRGTAWLGPIVFVAVSQVYEIETAFLALSSFFFVGILLLLPYRHDTAVAQKTQFDKKVIGETAQEEDKTKPLSS